jgi:hypothetical protein
MMAVRITTNREARMPRRQSSTTTASSEPFVADAPALALSDDECVRKLAMLIEHRDSTKLDEIVALIGRLAVPIELT